MEDDPDIGLPRNRINRNRNSRTGNEGQNRSRALPPNQPQIWQRRGPRRDDQPRRDDRARPVYPALQPAQPQYRRQSQERAQAQYRGQPQNQRGHFQGRNRPDMNQTHGDTQRGQRDSRQHNISNNIDRPLSFKELENIAALEPHEILEKLNERQQPFLRIIRNPDVTEDTYVLIVQILAKACLSSFDELKMKLLLSVCNAQYMMHLGSFIMELPYKYDKRGNQYYWNNQNLFWDHLITIFESILNMSPSVAMQKCRSLIEGSSKLCIDELNKRHGFVISEENAKRLDDLRERIKIFEKKHEENAKQGKFRGATEREDEEEPPEDFRQLSVIPSRDELLAPAFLRRNRVRGSYRDVDHYLDVQFRLLREDCFGPLRDGLLQYINNPQKQKYDNMGVYRNVKFVGPYVSNTKIGTIIQFDEKTTKSLQKTNWAQSKRFIFGSLLLFSKDGCQNFITATIVDREIKYLSQGMIPVSIVENSNQLTTENIIQTKDSYVMFESEVYFEPYFHVLKALQDPDFARNLAMSKYIVNVDPNPRLPLYLTEDSTFKVATVDTPSTSFRVSGNWPSHEELNLNESQFEAYKLALTHEFAVIQGPPGTGKTYLGVKVARTLLENIPTQLSTNCLMLIVCYTNHALDQFLEHILEVTPSIVRIGNQSKNEAMAKISLHNLRKSEKVRNYSANKLFYSQKNNLNMIMSQLKTTQNQIESLSNGILTYDSICEAVPEAEQFFYGYNARNGEDKLLFWLLNKVDFEVDDINPLLKNDDNDQTHNNTVDENDDIQTRTAYILDDLLNETNEMNIIGVKVKTTFMLHDADQKIKELISLYKRIEKREDKYTIKGEIRYLHYIKSVFLEMRNRHQSSGGPRLLRPGDSPAQLSNAERWAVYFTWANKAINTLREQIAPLQEELTTAVELYEESRMNLDLHLLKNTKVVGMTTSSAARLRKLLKALAPTIVIVEEAAEVLEQHIVTSLTKHCKHLILIGDHQQLRPSAANMRLARQYDIDVSLFERMVLNNMHSRRLRVQHRMRPEIAALISPHIYSDLENHPSVEAFPTVRGITANLFFYTHNHIENTVEESASRTNVKEADMALGLANYLMQQGYAPQEVTILAAYSGQMFYMRKQRCRYSFLDKVKITVVDNYQGEESKIILLSLVRNNNGNKIGFLSTENRICVALSRAKEGFYMFGNINILKANSTLWQKISKTLEDGGSLGTAFLLKCENHPDQISMISSVDDFEKVPEGGCSLSCNHNLPACGHPCPRICHGYDRSHSDVKCQLNCERIICEMGHVCPLKCAVQCKPCKIMVLKQLPCGHEMQVPCHREPADPEVKCTAVVAVRLPHCAHEVKKQCHVDIETFVCPVPCGARVDPCGHTCRRRCHVTDDPDHEKYQCDKACARAKKGCTAGLLTDRGDHQCTRRCHETCDECNVKVVKKRSKCKHAERIPCCKDVDEIPCRKKCSRVLPCLHFCKKKCFEKCGDCDQKVKKVIPDCKHTVEVECRIEPRRDMCGAACERRLECGHACARACAEPCSARLCTQLHAQLFRAPCGHHVRLPCNVIRPLAGKPMDKAVMDRLLLAHCSAPCGATLRCEHACAGSCAGCRQRRLHVPCAQPCRADNICAHPCEEPCNQVCPPCNKQCELKCPHSQCSRQCGAPCVPCEEECVRRCVHGACTRRCSEPCSRPACSAPCPAPLRCGHRCRGLCGEPCPPICNICSPDTFPKDFLGDDFDDDAKFIKLQDCTHILEVEDADNLMNGDQETVFIRACPMCRKPIINTYRYKDRINEMYRAEINPIKEKVYGTMGQVKEKQMQLDGAITKLAENYATIVQENAHFNAALKKLKSDLKIKKKSLLQLEMHFVYLNVMDMLAENIYKFKKDGCVELKYEFSEQVQMICDVLVANVKKISQQQQADISNELKRMGSILQLSKMFGHPAYNAAKTVPKVVEAAKTAKDIVLSWNVYEENKAIIALKKLQEVINVTGIVTKEEREMIVKAMGFKQGHWFKCPNGHFYCIADCGGAMVVAKCNECGAKIGGEQHRLREDNALAHEMDGAQHAAWSEFNNVVNFHFDD